jgi:predicted ATPase
MAMIVDMVAEDAQFVIATHSPILLAYPGARIVAFDEIPIRSVEYGDLESVRLVKDFLAAPERYLRGIVAAE